MRPDGLVIMRDLTLWTWPENQPVQSAAGCTRLTHFNYGIIKGCDGHTTIRGLRAIWRNTVTKTLLDEVAYTMEAPECLLPHLPYLLQNY